jgi:hypothetical protein
MLQDPENQGGTKLTQTAMQSFLQTLHDEYAESEYVTK